MEIFWTLFTVGCLATFGIAQWTAIRTGRSTYSRTIRRWLGIDPPKGRRRIAVLAFALVMVSFVVWFVPHIVWDLW